MKQTEFLNLMYITLGIIIAEKMNNFNAIDMLRKYQFIFPDNALNHNWHVFSDILGSLYTRKQLKINWHDTNGMVVYSLPEYYE